MTNTDPPTGLGQARADIAQARAGLERLKADLAVAHDRAGEIDGHLQAALLGLDDEEQPAPDPDPPPPSEADILAADRDAPTVIYGPTGLPLGPLPRTGAALDHNGAPDLAKYYLCAPGVDNGATRGTAPIYGAGDGRTLEIHLRAADKVAAGGGTGMHHKYFYLPAMAREITLEYWTLMMDPELGWTWKNMGFGRFEGAKWGDPAWKDYPAGSVLPVRTCMVRQTGWKYRTEDRSQARLATVVKAGRVVNPVKNSALKLSPRVRAWPGAEGPTNPDHSVSFVDDITGAPPAGTWIGTRMIGAFGTHGKPDGWLEVWRSIRHEPWRLTIRVDGLDWVQQLGPAGTTGAEPGFNHVVQTWMHGGDTTEWAPNNPTRTGRHLLRDMAVVPEVWRPKVVAA